MIVWAFADRVLPFIGLCTVIWFTVRGTLWAARTSVFKRLFHGETR